MQDMAVGIAGVRKAELRLKMSEVDFTTMEKHKNRKNIKG